jgi:hypothetical protein
MDDGQSCPPSILAVCGPSLWMSGRIAPAVNAAGTDKPHSQVRSMDASSRATRVPSDAGLATPA